MSKGITIKLGYTSSELRRLAASSRHANQSRRLLSIAAALDGMSRAEAARSAAWIADAAGLGSPVQRARS